MYVNPSHAQELTGQFDGKPACLFLYGLEGDFHIYFNLWNKQEEKLVLPVLKAVETWEILLLGTHFYSP